MGASPYRDVSGELLQGAGRFSFNISPEVRLPFGSDKNLLRGLSTSFISRHKSDNSLSDYSWIRAHAVSRSRPWLRPQRFRDQSRRAARACSTTRRRQTASWNSYTPAVPRWVGIQFRRQAVRSRRCEHEPVWRSRSSWPPVPWQPVRRGRVRRLDADDRREKSEGVQRGNCPAGRGNGAVADASRRCRPVSRWSSASGPPATTARRAVSLSREALERAGAVQRALDARTSRSRRAGIGQDRRHLHALPRLHRPLP